MSRESRVRSQESGVRSPRLIENCPAGVSVVRSRDSRLAPDKKVGGTGRWARSREIKEEGGKDGRLQRKRWNERLVRPTEQGTQGFFGRLAVRRPATLPLWPSIDRVNMAAVRCITRLPRDEDSAEMRGPLLRPACLPAKRCRL